MFAPKSAHNYLYSLVYNCQNLEVNKMPLNRWVDKNMLIHPFHGILFNDRNKYVINLWKDIKKTKCMLLSEMSQSKKTTYCMITPIWHSGKWRLWKDLWCWDWGRKREGWVDRVEKIFRTVKLFRII